MNLHLIEISRNVAAGAHALVVLDGAGWHQTGGDLRLPANISLLHLPPYAPEVDPVEEVWNWLKYDELPNFAPRDVPHLDGVVNRKLAMYWSTL